MCRVKYITEVCRSCGKDNWYGGNSKDKVVVFCATRKAHENSCNRKEGCEKEYVTERGALCNHCIKTGNCYGLQTALTADLPRLDISDTVRGLEWLRYTTAKDAADEHHDGISTTDYASSEIETEAKSIWSQGLTKFTGVLYKQKGNMKKLESFELQNMSDDSSQSSEESPRALTVPQRVYLANVWTRVSVRGR
ncbi:hypothetical protein JX265_002391 [Neoarthrinium moseri]|uniref:Uncharacterized protein n=1 Tax=Neoarthrinium moseri TaxID=1658444 RepID=A0A9P9WUU2_9PEZI|nr:hypothetical protein JX265_002391 [Neoarthrinium moseri]